jgi:H/ACA ribonucleoprotein complex subunit 2
MGKKEKDAKAGKEGEAQPVKDEASYDTKIKFCSVIAKPLADEKLCKRVLKLAKKASKRKAIRRGVKEVVKALRKNAKGYKRINSASFSRCSDISYSSV